MGYALYSDGATNQATWTEVIGYTTALYTDTTYSITSGVVPGATYYFKVLAKNKWGWGPESPTGSILAATTPSQVLNVATSIDGSTGGVTITWTEPTALGGIAIDSYTIEIQGTDDQWREEADCDGSDPAIRDARSCTIPMATLSSPDHSLPFDDLVYVRILATNTRGDGPLSDVNTDGARIRQAPAQMDPPTEGDGTTDSQVEVVWNAVTDPGLPTGNSDITAYKLLWDNGDGAAVTFVELTLSSALATSHTIVGIETAGSLYRFTIQAVNIYGESVASTIATIRASDVPSQPAEVSTTRSGLSLALSVTQPSANGADITATEVRIYSPNAGAYVEDTTFCDGSTQAFLDNGQCTFTFVYLMSTYGYVRGNLVLF